ncbi:uncharacterized protein PHACADRAFT_98109 [Phanerochaete carnosa HHB-10118-sp]|uniref:Uncharacterized protein n=1 Tax=Phanerochaete carnosa (strain HHB-10118-sp) TaxID=650164 RepID=K5W442_PHACS|nr:uncharacterized protein PHACADRAFT_98109 [Phanerochaete carnosa HHB-10118-sp]EKM53890.1 hypothetical protein PHACADRAFT_98109 [Phanerochaete carnosa HHB-10118-sp]
MDGQNKISQPLYFPADHPTMPRWFKGMEQIIQERGLWPERGLKAQCFDSFAKCLPGCTGCCCRRLLFNQPDFVSQKPQLQEYIESRGHFCDFYPKYHPETNFIEQYWGYSKLHYRNTPPTNNIQEMEKNVKEALDKASLLQIWRWANRAARFISSYAQGLNGAEAAYANRKFHGHRMLPAHVAASLKEEFKKWLKSKHKN